MLESVNSRFLYLSEPVQIQLPDETLKLIVPEILGENFGLYFFLIQNINHSSSRVPTDDFVILLILNKQIDTLRISLIFLMKGVSPIFY
jgi:hypothetical protein